MNHVLSRLCMAASFLLVIKTEALITQPADCPTGWYGFGDSCYLFQPRALTVRGLSWEDARRECLNYAGDLVSVANKSEMDFIHHQTIQHGKFEFYWIGLNDRRNESVFGWSDGTPFNGSVYSNWLPGEPNDRTDEDCAELHGSAWNDNGCEKEFGYICERPRGALMLNSTAASPASTFAPIACPSGWEFYGSSCYKFSNTRKNWFDAKTDCRQSGAFLLKIDDVAEQRFITLKLILGDQGQDHYRFWLGLTDAAVEGTYRWESDNSLVNYTHWAVAEPNNMNGVEDCVWLYGAGDPGFWNDDNCFKEYYYICEKPRDKGSNQSVLIVGTKDVLLSIDLSDRLKKTQIQVKNVMSIGFSSDPNLIYWSNKKAMNQLSLQTGVNEVMPFYYNDVNSLPFPEGLAVDWISHKLYWTDATRDAIYVGDLRNGRNVQIIEGNLGSPKAIAVSPRTGYIYWTNWGQAPHIERARADGTERQVFIHSGMEFLNSLALDEVDKKLFWAGTDDNKYGIIEAVSLDGSNRSVIFRQKGYHPYSLDTFEDYVYWTDRGRNAIFRIKSSGGEAEVIIGRLNNPLGLKILHRREERPGNSCDRNNGDCEYLCLPLVERQRCFCKEGMELDENGKKCKKHFLQGGKKNESVDLTSTPILIPMLLLIVAFTVVVFLVMRKRLKCSKPTDPPRSPHATGKKFQQDKDEQCVVEFAPDQTDPDLPLNDSQPNNSSADSNRQICNLESTRTCPSSGQVPGIVEYHVKAEIVNLTTNALKVDQVTYNMDQLNLQQSGGTAIFGDKATVNNFSQPPQNC